MHDLFYLLSMLRDAYYVNPDLFQSESDLIEVTLQETRDEFKISKTGFKNR